MLFKTKIKTKLYVTKIFGNDVVAMCEGKVTIKLIVIKHMLGCAF